MKAEVTIASDCSAARGICTRTGSGKVRHISIKKCAYKKLTAKEGVLVGVGGHAVELGSHRNEGTLVRAHDVVAEADVATPERRSDKGVGMPHRDERRTQCKPRRGWRKL